MIVGRLKSYGIDSVAQQLVAVTPPTGTTVTARNILGCINPDARERVLLLAHYDTRPTADNDPDPALRSTPIDGANDGASGVAVLLELGRLLGKPLPIPSASTCCSPTWRIPGPAAARIPTPLGVWAHANG